MIEKRAVEIWEDTVGDSGGAPTDAELLAFANAVQKETLERLADTLRAESLLYEDGDKNLSTTMSSVLHWASRRVRLYADSLLDALCN